MSEKKQIPEDPEAERSLVSCTWAGFRDRDAASPKALFALDPEAFLAPQARCLWLAMRGLYQRGEPIDPPVIWAELQRLGMETFLGNYAGVYEALSHNEFGNPDPLVRRLKELHDRRRMVGIAASLDTKARDLVQDHTQTLGDASSALMGLSLGSQDRPRRSGADLLDRLAEGKPFRDPRLGGKCFWFPFESWNDAIECAPGHVVIVGASPKVGKTALIVDGMVWTASHGVDTALISLEMDENEVESRLAGRLTGKNSRLFLKASWGHEVAAPALQNADMVARLHWWASPSGIPWSRVEAEIREMVRLEGCKSIVIDYFTLVGKPTGGKGASDASLWGSLSMAIKRLAQELQICIILLCQLNREGAEGEPFKNNLRETGQLEQDANAIVFLWKDGEMIYGKVSDNRSGPTVPGKVLEFDGGTCVFKMAGHETGGNKPSGW